MTTYSSKVSCCYVQVFQQNVCTVNSLLINKLFYFYFLISLSPPSQFNNVEIVLKIMMIGLYVIHLLCIEQVSSSQKKISKCITKRGALYSSQESVHHSTIFNNINLIIPIVEVANLHFDQWLYLTQSKGVKTKA